MCNEIASGFLNITYIALDMVWLFQIFKVTRYSVFTHSNKCFSIHLLCARRCVTSFKLKLGATTRSMR